MLRILTIAVFTALLATGATARAGDDAWRATSVSGEVRAGDGETVVEIGATFSDDVVIRTGRDGRATLARGGVSIVVGANARIRLSRGTSEVRVETGSAIIRRPGAMHDEVVKAGRSANLIARTSTVQDSGNDLSPRGSGDLPAPAAYVAPPQIRQSLDSHASSTMSEAGLAPRVPQGSGGEAAPALRFAPARDTDLAARDGGEGLRYLPDADTSEVPRSSKTDEQKLAAIRGTWEAVSRNGLPHVDERAAERLLRKIKPDADAERPWTEDQASIARIAAIAMAVLIMAQLAIMGVVALWRAVRRAKAERTQPRWTTI